MLYKFHSIFSLRCLRLVANRWHRGHEKNGPTFVSKLMASEGRSEPIPVHHTCTQTLRPMSSNTQSILSGFCIAAVPPCLRQAVALPSIVKCLACWAKIGHQGPPSPGDNPAMYPLVTHNLGYETLTQLWEIQPIERYENSINVKTRECQNPTSKRSLSTKGERGRGGGKAGLHMLLVAACA